jgi:hypothetical protein
MPKRPLWTPLRRKIFAGFLTANYFFFILLFPFSTAQAMPLFRGTFLPHGNDITISSVVYGFLGKNSSINAGELNMHYESQLVEYRDYIRQGDRRQVFAVVEKSKTLEPEHVRSIMALRTQPTTTT